VNGIARRSRAVVGAACRPSAAVERRLLGLVALAILVGACTSSGSGPAEVAGSVSPVPPVPPGATGGADSGGYGGRGDYGTDGGYGLTATDPPATAAPAGSAAGDGTVREVRLSAGSMGSYLTGEGGLTLYVFTRDAPNASACSGQCAANWPPFTVAPGEMVKAAAGVSGSLTTFIRADGTAQVAHDGSPLYYYAGDEKPREANGEGVGGVWFVARP